MKYTVTLVILVLAIIAASIYMVRSHPLSLEAGQERITIDNVPIIVDVATSTEAREHGLSGRSSLSEGKGMLFVFDKDGIYGFWMKDMQFPIDILWADASGNIITLSPNIAPSTYPQVFYPTAPARYVLEVPAGFAARHHLTGTAVLHVPEGLRASATSTP